MKSIRCLAVMLAIPLGALAAQETLTIGPGDRIRVTATDRTVVGTLESLDSITMVVRREDGTADRLPRSGTTRVEVSSGANSCRSHRRETCVIAGLLSGAALGVGVGLIAESQCDFCGGKVLPITLAAGTLLGALVGAVVGRERWTRAELSR